MHLAAYLKILKSKSQHIKFFTAIEISLIRAGLVYGSSTLVHTVHKVFQNIFEVMHFKPVNKIVVQVYSSQFIV